MYRCGGLAHDACGKDPWAPFDEVGYPDVARGEALYDGFGADRSPRAALDGWLASPSHRRMLLDPIWTEQGVAVLRPELEPEGEQARAIWVAHVGGRR